jgi:dihydroorotate dehydrogenase (fumarate)
MDLTTKYMGLDLKNPLVVSASPLQRELDNVRQMEDAGASAIVMFSLFEEQVVHEVHELDHYLEYGTESFPEALSYLPEPVHYHKGPDEYLEHIKSAKEAVDIPIIGSLNGISLGGWIEYAKEMEKAGADALELNVYFIPTDPGMSGVVVENRYIEILQAVKATLKIPVAMKLSPYFSSMGWMAKRLDEAGADALVLFNRFYQPDIDLESMKVEPNVLLSTPYDMRLPLRWIAILHGRIDANLAASSGIHAAEDIVKMLLVGADVTMMTSALLKNGINHLRHVLRHLRYWLSDHEYESVSQMKGSMSQQSSPDPSSFERANYMRALNEYKVDGV